MPDNRAIRGRWQSLTIAGASRRDEDDFAGMNGNGSWFPSDPPAR
jgi:hypothetical protein